MKVHRVLGEAVDTLCFLVILTGTLFLFSYYWSDSYQLEYTEYVIEIFFDEAERLQKISAEDYESLQKRIMDMNGQYELSLQIKRKEEVYYQNDIRKVFREEECFELREGDFIVVTIIKGKQKRAVLSTVVWW